MASNLQAELESRGVCEVDMWRHVFDPSNYALPSLLAVARRVDFAVLVATPDDTTVSRGVETAAVRDNIVLEFGLFAGALGHERTYLLATGDLKLPSDVLGLTRLPYRERQDGDLRAAVNGAVLDVQRQVRTLGPRPRGGGSGETPAGGTGSESLNREIELLCRNAEAQGWAVKANSATTLRLRSPEGQAFTLTKRQSDRTRADLRHFAARLRAGGLRVNSVVRGPIEDSPL